ncbi:2-hydroxy-6-oxo-6-phenylhexa-2,4-dienoate hydrolase [Paractinoplanes deccanensis]|uniref:2-hydroxy-6-oxo-6-phenylhexa-2,4-dienoate hydrolase n=1 Tax=Paractinoplanes deccanensis TaxID=113561 RepID=A0ABQ3YAJ3_9ACTN|nr:alpha/beta hydrolase [Actinoplanes deccanensis]GID76945.1 2-hydroxy-6-oxo-6-phenylhexa-2,4-dienoate hydrolase [Actinoplanes deccanensis]
MFVERRGDGTPVLLLHGFGVDHRILLPLEEVFAAHPGWQRLYLDLPGFGRTPGSDDVRGSDDVVAAVCQFVDAELGERPFALVGNSWGGMLARAITARMPERVLGLCLLCPAVVADREARELPARTVLRSDPGVVSALSRQERVLYQEMAVVESAEDGERFREYVLPGILATDQRAMARIEADYDVHPEPEKGPAYEGPTLLLTGRQDDVTGYRDVWRVLEHYPRATFAVLDAAGHNAALERPEVAHPLVADWLARVSAEAR